MNLKQLRVFQEVMLTGSVSQTARNLNRTQPSVSSSISALEQDLGVNLFDRRGGRLHPVPEAQYLLKESSDVLRRVNTISQTIHRITSLEIGELRIASMPGPSVYYLPDTIASYTQDNSEIKATLASRSTDAVINLVATQQYDIGICDNHPDLQKESGLLSTEILQYPCVVALHAEDELAGEKRIRLQQLDNKPMGILFDDHASHQQIKDAFNQSQLTLNTVFSTQYFLPLLTYVEQDLACAIVDPLTAKSYTKSRSVGDRKIVFKPLVSPIMFELAIIRPSQRPASLLADNFYGFMHARLKQLQAVT